MFYNKLKKLMVSTLAIFISFSCLVSSPIKAIAAKDYEAEAEARKNITIESNLTDNWPQGPVIGAQSAILMEVNSGTILYEKNIHEELYPASITKILTALIAVEKCDLNEMVTFSDAAVHSINWKEDANIGINVGNQITMEECLYGLLVGSANEVAYAMAEHISGSVEEFAVLMNEKAKELGCTHSNFVTPNGIHDNNHYTSAHDMALIAQAFFSNELLSKMSSTVSYHIPQTATQPRDDMIVWAKSKLLPGKEYTYDSLVGTKTGYTTEARQTLVSCAEKNGLKLVCVVLMEEAPYQFEDTVSLFNYGFENFRPYSIADNDTNYNVDSDNFFASDTDFFGSSKPIMQLDTEDYIVLPTNADFDDTVSELTYEGLEKNEIARIEYRFNNVYVGYGSIVPIEDEQAVFDFGTKQTLAPKPVQEQKTVYINVKNIIICVILISFLLMLLFMLKSFISNVRKSRRRSRIMNKHKGSTKHLDWKNFKP